MTWNPEGLRRRVRLGVGHVVCLTSKTDGLADGMKVDAQGNVYTTGPGGVRVFSPEGKHLGTIKPPEVPANCGWGDDGKTLYMTAVTAIERVATLAGK
ncbi:MAG: SMP-30/gluconolactonase/LRE family protein [Acidobacteriota bacterium]